MSSSKISFPAKSNQELISVDPNPLDLSTNELPALAAGLVHEAKNPLASIHLHLQLLEGYVDEVSDKKLKNKLHNKIIFIKNEISGLDKSLQNFLKLIRNEQPLANQKINLNQILESVIQLLAPQASQDQIQIELQTGRLTYLQHADEGFIKQIAINLIINAIQAFSEIDSEDKSAIKRIIVKTGIREGLAFMMIADNGPGIPTDMQQKVFEPWFTTKSNKGSGIGLALVKKMVAEMNAHLEIQSEINKGTSITILFSHKATNQDSK